MALTLTLTLPLTLTLTLTKELELGTLYERLQAAEAKAAQAEDAADTLRLQADVTAAERGAEISRLEVARDESLQAAAALRRRLEGAETAQEELQASGAEQAAEMEAMRAELSELRPLRAMQAR